MDEFENSLIRGVHISRYIASWLKTGAPLRRKGLFEGWLKTLNLTDEEIYRIVCFAENGKLEFQDSAEEFLHERGF